MNCAPVLDVPVPGAHDIIGDRALAHGPDAVGDKGLRACRAFLAQGITPIIKHIPGHGRARCDSHLELPIVDEQDLENDFAPFRMISKSDVGRDVWAMSAHITYSAYDDLPATLSPRIINDIIREDIGFKGFLVSDDIEMKALSSFGSLPELALGSLKAGCDAVLHCSGDFESMQSVAQNLPVMRKAA